MAIPTLVNSLEVFQTCCQLKKKPSIHTQIESEDKMKSYGVLRVQAFVNYLKTLRHDIWQLFTNRIR